MRSIWWLWMLPAPLQVQHRWRTNVDRPQLHQHLGVRRRAAERAGRRDTGYDVSASQFNCLIPEDVMCVQNVDLCSRLNLNVTWKCPKLRKLNNGKSLNRNTDSTCFFSHQSLHQCVSWSETCHIITDRRPAIRPTSSCNLLRRAKRWSRMCMHTYESLCGEIGSAAKEGREDVSDRLARVYFLTAEFRFLTVLPAIP